MFTAKDKDRRRKQSEKRRSISASAGAPSKIISSKFAEMEGAEQTEIAAQITVPTDGGWGWVVLMAAFGSSFILDGCVMTFGSLLKDVSKDLQVTDATAAFVSSLQLAIYLMLSPIASAFINRFGFRICGMLGSIICCYSALGSSLVKGISSFFFLYGLCYGVGCCFINMAAGLVVGFYFEKYRTLAMVFVTAGSSFGIMLLFPLNLVLVNIAGWRSTVLLHSGLVGLVYFLSLTYKPLLQLTITKVDDEEAEPTRTVTYLPTVASAGVTGGKQARANTTERLFGAVSNVRFPTAAAVIQDETAVTTAGPSQRPGVSRITLSTTQGVSRAQLNQVKSMISRGVVKDQPAVEIQVKVEPEKKKSCWGRLCEWEAHASTARPMYRDDAFYDGKIERLPQYQKSIADAGDTKTGLEYQMAVSRAITVGDLQNKRGVLTTSVRRILVTMCDFELLKKKSFLFYSLSGAAGYMGLNIPYVYLQDRNMKAGVDAVHCTYFVSVIGFSNAFGRMVWSIIAMKVKPLYLYIIGCSISGLSTVASGLSYSVIYQYVYSFAFGFNVCVISAMRSLIIVDLYGLERLTNGTGLLLLFMGIGNLFGTPVAGILKDSVSYDTAFYFSGCLLILASFFGMLVRWVEKSEKLKSNPKPQTPVDKRHSKGKALTPKDFTAKSAGIGAVTIPKLSEPTATVVQPLSIMETTPVIHHATETIDPSVSQQTSKTEHTFAMQTIPVLKDTLETQTTSVKPPTPRASRTPSTSNVSQNQSKIN